LYGIT